MSRPQEKNCDFLKKCVFDNYRCEYCWQHAKDNDKIFWQLKFFVVKNWLHIKE
jgi:hypothetical protein